MDTNTNAPYLFQRYEAYIRRQAFCTKSDGKDCLLMDREGDYSIYYAPLDYVNIQARLVLVGITPGETQMLEALNHSRTALVNGANTETALRAAKKGGSFSGTQMRKNLLGQLNDWGIADWLEIRSCEELFQGRADLVHTTSLLKYPTFYKGKNYEGGPSIVSEPLLRKYLLGYFAMEARQLKDAIFVGMGPKVWMVLDWLVGDGVIARENVCNGMMHPSPHNTNRLDWILGDRASPIPWRTNPAHYDSGRRTFRGKVGLAN